MVIASKPKWAIRFHGSEWPTQIHVNAHDVHRDKKDKSVCWADGIRIEVPNAYDEGIMSIEKVDYLLNED